MDLAGRKVLVVGSGISGISAVELLQRVNATPLLFDENASVTREQILAKFKNDAELDIIIGSFPNDLIESLDYAVLSPGVPIDSPFAALLLERGVPVWGEIELAYRLSKGKLAAITGTNGKTTTTALTGAIMEHYFKSVFVVGNIGNPYTAEVLSTKEDSVTIAEISSFQLETIEKFRPDVGAILNITPDHLNRHHTMECYIETKEKITKNQTGEDTCVLNYDDEITREFGKTLHTKVLYFSRKQILKTGICLDGDDIVYKTPLQTTSICKVHEMKLIGSHNIENAMAAIGIAVSMKVPAEIIRDTILSFQAVEHRIEYVAEKNGVIYYNDSKGTNPDAAIKGIRAMSRPTVLIGGGYDKDSKYKEWIESFDEKVKYLILLGQTKEKIAKEARECGFTNIIFAENLKEAVEISAEKAVQGDAVLLSPACASWGMFKNYEERGNMFKEYVKSLPEAEKKF